MKISDICNIEVSHADYAIEAGPIEGGQRRVDSGLIENLATRFTQICRFAKSLGLCMRRRRCKESSHWESVPMRRFAIGLKAAFRSRFIADGDWNELQKSGDSNSRKQIVQLSSRSISAGNLVFFVLTKGMSLIGPRPERPAFCAEFEKRIHGWHYRTMIAPGLSGLAQVTGGYDLLPKEKVVLDL